MSDDLIAVTGATGGLGRRVVRRLADAGVAPRLVVRNPDRADPPPGAQVRVAAYEDATALRTALTGVGTLLFVSATEHPDRVGLHRGVVDAAVAAGVGRVVYVSFLGAAPEATFTFARDHWHTEQHIRASGLRFTFLRDSLYQDALPFFAGADGVIRGPAAAGRFAPVARDDIAAAAVAVLLDTGHDGRTYDLTGPELLTMADVAAELTRAAGRPVRFENETVEEAYASRAHYGAAQYELDGWISSYTAIAAGELDLVSDAVTTLAGRPPVRFADWLAANPESVRHLRPAA